MTPLRAAASSAMARRERSTLKGGRGAAAIAVANLAALVWLIKVS